MEQLEVLPGDRVFVTLAQEAQVVGTFQVFHPRGVASELLVISADGAGILHSAMNQFLFPVAPDIESNRGKNCGRRDHQQRHHEKKREQNIAALIPAGALG